MGMFTMNAERRAKWERTRAKGAVDFVVIYGVVFTIAMSVTMSVFDYFVDFRGFQPEKLKFEIPFFLALGVITGTAVWLTAEWQYKKSSGPA